MLLEHGNEGRRWHRQLIEPVPRPARIYALSTLNANLSAVPTEIAPTRETNGVELERFGCFLVASCGDWVRPTSHNESNLLKIEPEVLAVLRR